MATSNEIRRTYLDFFGKNGHEIVDSSPLVPRNDPTLMFTNAGMVQFKNTFIGQEQRAYNRATTSQKCVRAGGKHNDLDNVGYTARHHTFFEMLGNFSFGDYFKDDAINFAWNLITKEFELPKEKLLVTVYSEDEEAASIWKKVAGIGDDKIIRIPTSDNFWSMGDTGPCGPCTEIFYDHGDHIWGGPPGSPEEDGDRFIEIWNLVFMQYEQLASGERINLPKPSIDTGMGLERITAVLQGTHDNYETDLMKALIETSAEFSNVDPYGEKNVSHRVIADHLRCSAFLLADGVMPSNEGRGYVLRRIMRRAMRHAHMLGCQDPLMYKLVPALIAQMGQHYTELGRAEALITETLKLEETRFKKTLDRGLRLLDEESDKLGDKGTLDGEVAFKLYDTYGFPLDLTADILRSQEKKVDTDAFNAAMERQRAEARKNWKGSGDAATETIWFEAQDKFGATEFLGYETETAEAEVVGLIVDGKMVDTASQGDTVYVITNQTPFYGESGGQIGDTGTLKVKDTFLTVTDTQKKVGSLFVHLSTVAEGVLKVGDHVEMSVDVERRNKIRANHSATHLLHESLRRRLGDHITQKGSLVDDQRLRFDISSPAALTAEDIQAVEQMVNARIRANTAVTTKLMSPEEAVEAGAMALFGEKYGEEVRVVSMGGLLSGENRVYSVELCGGTHVKATGDIGAFKIVNESAVAAGIRRIEAFTGDAAMTYLSEQETLLHEASVLLRTPATSVPERLSVLIEERKKMEKELADLRRKVAISGGNAADQAQEAKEIHGIKFASRILKDLAPKELKPMADEMKKQLGSAVITLISVDDKKASIVVAVTDDLKEKHNAVDLVRVGSAALGGKGGGGRPDMAQAGGPDSGQAEKAIAEIEAALAS